MILLGPILWLGQLSLAAIVELPAPTAVESSPLGASQAPGPGFPGFQEGLAAILESLPPADADLTTALDRLPSDQPPGAFLLKAASSQPEETGRAAKQAGLPPETAAKLAAAVQRVRRAAAYDPELAARLKAWSAPRTQVPAHLRNWNGFLEIQPSSLGETQLLDDGSVLLDIPVPQRLKSTLAERFPEYAQPSGDRALLPPPHVLAKGVREASGFRLSFPRGPLEDRLLEPRRYLEHLAAKSYPLMDIHDILVHLRHLFERNADEYADAARTALRILKSPWSSAHLDPLERQNAAFDLGRALDLATSERWGPGEGVPLSEFLIRESMISEQLAGSLPPYSEREGTAAWLRSQGPFGTEVARRTFVPQHLRDWRLFDKVSHGGLSIPTRFQFQHLPDGGAIITWPEGDGAPADEGEMDFLRERLARFFPSYQQPADRRQVRLPAPYELAEVASREGGFTLAFPRREDESRLLSNPEYHLHLKYKQYPFRDLHDLTTHWPHLMSLRADEFAEAIRMIEWLGRTDWAESAGREGYRDVSFSFEAYLDGAAAGLFDPAGQGTLAAYLVKRSGLFKSVLEWGERAPAKFRDLIRGLRERGKFGNDLADALLPSHLKDWRTFAAVMAKSPEPPGVMVHLPDGGAILKEFPDEGFSLEAAKERLEASFPGLSQPSDPLEVRLPSPYELAEATLRQSGFTLEFPRSPAESQFLSDEEFLEHLRTKRFPFRDLHDLSSHWPRLPDLDAQEFSDGAEVVQGLAASDWARTVGSLQAEGVLGAAAAALDSAAARRWDASEGSNLAAFVEHQSGLVEDLSRWGAREPAKFNGLLSQIRMRGKFGKDLAELLSQGGGPIPSQVSRASQRGAASVGAMALTAGLGLAGMAVWTHHYWLAGFAAGAAAIGTGWSLYGRKHPILALLIPLYLLASGCALLLGGFGQLWAALMPRKPSWSTFFQANKNTHTIREDGAVVWKSKGLWDLVWINFLDGGFKALKEQLQATFPDFKQHWDENTVVIPPIRTFIERTESASGFKLLFRANRLQEPSSENDRRWLKHIAEGELPIYGQQDLLTHWPVAMRKGADLRALAAESLALDKAPFARLRLRDGKYGRSFRFAAEIQRMAAQELRLGGSISPQDLADRVWFLHRIPKEEAPRIAAWLGERGGELGKAIGARLDPK